MATFKFCTSFFAIILGFKFSIVTCVVQSDVRFFLYSRESPVTPTELVTGQLNNVLLNNTREFKFIIHGYIDNANRTWVLEMKNQYLIKGPYYIIAVDWSVITEQLLYPVSAFDTRDVGKYIANFITDLHDTLGVSYDLFHLVGHSLGAHVSGFCGKALLSNVNNTVARISGLDPAGPLFFGRRAAQRLALGDAKFVDVIHTNDYKFGYFDAIGNIDFYPNGGTFIQPGCIFQTIDELLLACSHSRSFMYFSESINSLGFVANVCDNFYNYLEGLCSNNERTIMGENVNQNQSGIFYLTTNSEPPFPRFGEI